MIATVGGTTYQTRHKMTHPAKFSDSILPEIRRLLDYANQLDVHEVDLVLDPFAGTGRIHELRPVYTTIGIELEPEWAAMSEYTEIGDALHVARPDGLFDAIATSPAYANRMADRDMRESVGGTYMKSLHREASAGSSCHLQWGNAYRDFHLEWLAECWRLLRDCGWLIINMSDHIRNKERQHVVDWFIEAATTTQFRHVTTIDVPTRRMRRGANGSARVEAEQVMLFRKV